MESNNEFLPSNPNNLDKLAEIVANSAMNVNSLSEFMGNYTKKQERFNNQLKDTVTDLENEVKQDKKELEQRMDSYEDNVKVTHAEKVELQNAVSRRVSTILGDTKSPDYVSYSKTFFMRLWWSYKRHFGIPTYDETKKKDYQDALEYIEAWVPNQGIQALKDEIDQKKIVKARENLRILNEAIGEQV